MGEESIEDTSAEWKYSGAHRIRLEPPDIFFVRWASSRSAPEFARIFDVAERFFAVHPRLFWMANTSGLADASSSSTLSAEAREVGMKRLRTLRLAVIVLFNAQFHPRVVTKLILEAVQILQSSIQIQRLMAFLTVAKSRAWIAEERGRLGQPHQR